MIRLVGLALAALCLTQIAQAQRLSDAAPVRIFDQTRIQKIDYGLVCPAGETVELPAPGTHLGVIKQRQGWQKIEYTTQVIPMLKGIGFGVEADPFRDLTEVEISIFHPPYSGTDVTEERWTTDFASSQQNLNFFTFEFPFELVPGRWSIQATQGSTMLYTIEFDVVEPNRFPNIDGLCDGPAVLS